MPKLKNAFKRHQTKPNQTKPSGKSLGGWSLYGSQAPPPTSQQIGHGQNKKWKCTFGTFLHHRVSVISGGTLLIFKHSLFSSLCFKSVIGGYKRGGSIATDSWALLATGLVGAGVGTRPLITTTQTPAPHNVTCAQYHLLFLRYSAFFLNSWR